MVSQRLANAPHGYNEAFKRCIQAFKQIRHLYQGHVYHKGLLGHEDQWQAIEFAAPDRSEAVAYAFREGSEKSENIVLFHGLEPEAGYHVRQFNLRPGRELTRTGAQLAAEGIALNLPESMLSGAQYKQKRMSAEEWENLSRQTTFGSEVIWVKKM